MVQMLLKRLVGLIMIVLAVTFVTFILGYLAPGDPIRTLLGQQFNPTVYALIRHKYGLDQPWYQQYWNFLVNLVHFNLGLSFTQTNRPVWDILKEGVPISVELGFWALVIEYLVGIPLGVLSATRANTWVASWFRLVCQENGVSGSHEHGNGPSQKEANAGRWNATSG